MLRTLSHYMASCSLGVQQQLLAGEQLCTTETVLELLHMTADRQQA